MIYGEFDTRIYVEYSLANDAREPSKTPESILVIIAGTTRRYAGAENRKYQNIDTIVTRDTLLPSFSLQPRMSDAIYEVCTTAVSFE